MEVGAGDIDGRHFCVGYNDAFGIAILVELAVHGQTGAGSGRGDQLNDGLVADQRFGMTAPSRTMPRAPGAVVRKPPMKESAVSEAPGSAGGTMGIWLGARGAPGVDWNRARSDEEGQTGR
jgi:hypothetical protein